MLLISFKLDEILFLPCFSWPCSRRNDYPRGKKFRQYGIACHVRGHGRRADAHLANPPIEQSREKQNSSSYQLAHYWS